ncbi:MAG: hypothetical protein ACP5IL_15110 [Syntrophobacteraceae bacterium]
MDRLPGGCSEAKLEGLIDGLLIGPRYPQKEFVLGRTTYAELYGMAARLLATFGSGENKPPICLCSHDKAVVAAALLCGLAGGRAVILPHAFSIAVLEELRDLMDFEAIVIDGASQAPAGFRCFQLEASAGSLPSLQGMEEAIRIGHSCLREAQRGLPECGPRQCETFWRKPILLFAIMR